MQLSLSWSLSLNLIFLRDTILFSMYVLCMYRRVCECAWSWCRMFSHSPPFSCYRVSHWTLIKPIYISVLDSQFALGLLSLPLALALQFLNFSLGSGDPNPASTLIYLGISLTTPLTFNVSVKVSTIIECRSWSNIFFLNLEWKQTPINCEALENTC